MNNEECKIRACGKNHGCTIVGAILLIVATILTLITFSGLGILGMFLVGLAFCCHKHMCCKMCHCGCRDHSVSCDVETETTLKKPDQNII